MAVSGIKRGCGVRQPGGAYLVTALSPRGMPLEHFVLDPPRPINPAQYGLAPQGMTLATGAPAGRSAHLVDWVGANNYPNVADFLEEASLFGTSRRLPSNFAFDKLGPDSTHLFVHPRAGLLNPQWLHENRAIGGNRDAPPPSFLARAMKATGCRWCPFRKGSHEAPGPVNFAEMCATFWWEALLPETLTFKADEDAMEAQCERASAVLRELPSAQYTGYALPDPDIWTPKWELAAFLALPVTRVEVVRDPGDMSHDITMSRAVRAHIPVELVDD